MNLTLIRNATIINEGMRFKGSILIEGSFIKKIYSSGEALPDFPGNIRVIEAENKIMLPGVIDDQVHFRQPGLTYKGDLYTESTAAVAGGVTSVMDMPNTIPQTTTQELLEEKYQMGASDCLCNYSFYMGATNTNIGELMKTNPANVCGIKVFMGASTGNMLVDNPDSLEQIFKNSPLLIATHCEDENIIRINLQQYKDKYNINIPVAAHRDIRSSEACYRSSSLAVELAKKFNSRLHVLHLSTAKEMSLFSNENDLKNKKITSEVCIHHLWFSDKDYESLGSRIKWNPSVKTGHDRQILWEALLDGRLDIIATDHAPHTLDEKNRKYLESPSGGPMIQHSLVAMLECASKGQISIEKTVEKMCHAPAEIFNIHKRGFLREGYFADITLVENSNWTVTPPTLLYKCGWSPMEGQQFSSKVTHTFVSGNLVYENGTVIDRNRGMRITFDREKH